MGELTLVFTVLLLIHAPDDQVFLMEICNKQIEEYCIFIIVLEAVKETSLIQSVSAYSDVLIGSLDFAQVIDNPTTIWNAGYGIYAYWLIDSKTTVFWRLLCLLSPVTSDHKLVLVSIALVDLEQKYIQQFVGYWIYSFPLIPRKNTFQNDNSFIHLIPLSWNNET